jgi:hypothetical protein
MQAYTGTESAACDGLLPAALARAAGPGQRRDYRTRWKSASMAASFPGMANGDSAAAGLLSIAVTAKVWPLLLVAR